MTKRVFRRALAVKPRHRSAASRSDVSRSTGKKLPLPLLAGVAALLVAAVVGARWVPADAQGIPGFVVLPDSSVEHAGDNGVRAHTNHLIQGRPQAASAVPTGETPASIRTVYNLPATGGGGVIAIVDAFHYPTALNDFNVFSNQFGLPTEPGSNPLASTNQVFQVIYASGKQPRTNGGWAQEAALDIEWAHAMAPGAKIVLVEAASNSYTDLFKAVDVASTIPNVRQISMSWGGSEFSSETGSNYDGRFLKPNIVYFAASGDTGGKTIWPGTSRNVVSAGGTTINRNSAGGFLSESAWSGSGGGQSLYEPLPSYQIGIASSNNLIRRGAPDFSFDANPSTGVSVYDSTKYQRMSGWLVFGGTSVSAPALAGIVNLAHSGFAVSGGTWQELTDIYNNLPPSTSYSTNIRDITSGTAGTYGCTVGWDFVTGVGSNLGLLGK
jgi:subtilase family serine protease